MNDSLDHIPEEKQTELRRIVPIIREMCDDVEMIILFGSYARGDYREDGDLAPDRKSGAPSDYDILVVCRRRSSAANHPLWDSISSQCNGLDPTTPFRIIVHDVKYIKDRLREMHYFFSDILREGRFLYNSHEYKLEIGKELTPEQKLRAAEEHYGNWFEGAEQLFAGFEYFLKRMWYKKAAFLLHQAAESAFKALLLVYTNYSSYNHYLDSMDRQSREILPEMEDIFPRHTEAGKELFKLFDYAYIGGRYDPEYKISKEDLEYLSGRVKLLMELTEKLCHEKIESLKKTLAV